MTRRYPCRVSPFGHPRFIACLPAPRGFSQAPASFFASCCQGIHHVPFVALLTTDFKRPIEVLDHSRDPEIDTATTTISMRIVKEHDPARGRSLKIRQKLSGYGDSVCPPPRWWAFSPKGGDPAAGSPTATLLRLHPSRRPCRRRCSPLRVEHTTSGTANSHGVTGGVYKARERIHRGMLIRDY